MRGIQVAQALSQRGLNTKVRFGLSPLALRNVRDSIVVCVKSRPRFTSSLKRRGNQIVYDAIDFRMLRGIPTVVDAVITGSDFMRSSLQGRLQSNTLARTIYHHADPHLQTHTTDETALHLAYIGEQKESKFVRGQIPDLHFVSFQKGKDWREKIRDYNAHFSARLDLHKSVVKLANVAVLGAVFLTGAEPGCKELLGEEYPFFLKNPANLTDVLEDVAKLKSAVGTDIWKAARERVEETKSKLTIQATAQAYEKLFSDLA